ncbi:hypothetical protein LN996_13145 [Arthrobacter sp. AK01]|uniref:hypothetical protein n=1 Tax=Micrococcaceae TaxID=1268 RepID=UPI001E4E7AB5|nr:MULTISPECIES: hypothetical protein [Micrococcaceae]MCD4851761.1 hypothetical protein [Arthrobacter sp. AK01]MCP1411936.1 putative repeat protein (TIGR01451 family) [Paenarthrobacter sp. A20]
MDIQRPRPFLKLMRAIHKDAAQQQNTIVRVVPPLRSAVLARKINAGHVALVYGADRPVAIPGDTVIFTAWITNDSPSHLRDVTLVPRSFTNEGMEMLSYTAEPVERDLRIRRLAPGQSVMRSFSYLVTDADHVHGGSLVSAMQVRATCRGQVVSDEHDAIVSLSGTRRDWPFPSDRAEQPRRRSKDPGQPVPA